MATRVENMNKKASTKRTAIILGGSSGLGFATAKKLLQEGFSVFIIHRDRRTDLEQINDAFKEITLSGNRVHLFNMDALKQENRSEIIHRIKEVLEDGARIDVLVHSLAKGNLKPMRSPEKTELNGQDFGLTIAAMASSLFEWTKALYDHGLFAEDARVISYTSEGNTKAWANYAAVSAAKAALEAITRNIALEFAPVGIKANCIQAGVTLTPSFERIPGHETLKENALLRNPNKRLTVPEDVANVAYLLTTKEAQWITGTVITVDGGESLR
ncbi:SDR family NAD(P)-dependent oxidoreductase [Maribacter sp. 2-571]|uniref:SDR family NAD(P)-dependent oxidoreductase n=1 Tax=Maribacter sp. 2-571 TaxID=3417569 RepID=UPI003D338BD5